MLNMAAPFTERTKEQQSVIRFLWSESVKAGEIYEGLVDQHGGNRMSQREICEWVEGPKGSG
jgi:hypothetical protein